MKFVFLDTEFTGLHAFPTLISVGLVTLEGQELCVTLNDYDRGQINEWLKEHVLSQIDESQSLSSKEACHKVSTFLTAYAKDDLISLVSAGKTNDHLLLFQLWHALYPQQKHFHFSNLPDYLYHDAHLDLYTLFFAAGYDPNEIIRDKFIDNEIAGTRHDALYDAKVVRACFLKLIRSGRLPHLEKGIGGV